MGTDSDTRLDCGGWLPIDSSFPRHHSWWIVWDDISDRPAVCHQRDSEGVFWADDWTIRVDAKLYLPCEPPPPLPLDPSLSNKEDKTDVC